MSTDNLAYQKALNDHSKFSFKDFSGSLDFFFLYFESFFLKKNESFSEMLTFSMFKSFECISNVRKIEDPPSPTKFFQDTE